MNNQQMKSFLREAFTAVIEDVNATEETYANYFSKEYIQHVDNETLDYEGFVAHMKAQKAAVAEVNIHFEHMVCEDDKICTVHYVNAIKKDGKAIEAKVNALFQIKDNKLVLCDELTHLIKGDESDRDLGSRR